MPLLRLKVNGMSCSACEAKIVRALEAQPGVVQASADYVTGSLTVELKPNSDLSVVPIMEELGYDIVQCEDISSSAMPRKTWPNKSILIQLGGLLALVLLVLVVSPAINFDLGALNSTAGYGTLFVVGLFTSVHCIGMCGGINMSQCISYNKATGSTSVVKPSLLYNLGRLLSYTMVGGLAGALGSAFNISVHFKGMISLLAGLFMVIMGLNLLGLMGGLRKLIPKMPSLSFNQSPNAYGPLFVGILNGFMPCGPLQAAQLYALSTGSATAGALSMFYFGLGTFPVMFTFGSISTMLGNKFTSKLLKISGVFVIMLGVMAMDRGLGLVNISAVVPGGQKPQSAQVSVKIPQGSVIATIKNGYQEVYVSVAPRGYAAIVVQKDIPVRMIFVVKPGNLNGCNNAIIIPSLNIQQPLIVGETLVEFIPTTLGEVKYACWMNMIRSTITVVADLSKLPK